ncbi:MAG: SRPBCC family protein [Pseudomonadota bacterium]
MKTPNDQNLQLGKWIGGAALGALAMYVLDPERGAPRRAESRDKLRQLGRKSGSAFDRVVDDIGNSMSQAGSGLRNLAGDAMTAMRDTGERAAGGASAMASTAPNSRTMDSPAYQSSGSSDALTSMSGAMSPDGLAWGSGTRGAAMAGGGALGLYGLMTQRSPMAMMLGLAGMVLLARAASNKPLRNMVPASAQARPVEIEKSVRIDAAPEQVYDLFANYEHFPRFLSNVIEVRDLGNRRSHWVVKGPAGSRYTWNAVLSEHSRPQRLAWQSEPGAEVENYGSIHFEPVGRGATRVTVRMSYKPPAGMVGRAIASLFGNEPGQQMEQDLQRMKSLVERGSIMPSVAQSGQSQSRMLH